MTSDIILAIPVALLAVVLVSLWAAYAIDERAEQRRSRALVDQALRENGMVRLPRESDRQALVRLHAVLCTRDMFDNYTPTERNC